MTQAIQRTPTLAEIIELGARWVLENARFSLPGVVESYDAVSQRVEVAVGIKLARENGEVEQLPMLVEVPVAHWRVGAFAMHAHLSKGDTVRLVIIEASIDEWLEKPGANILPADPRRHALEDAVAVPDLVGVDKRLAVAARPEGAMWIGHESGDTGITISAARVDVRAARGFEVEVGAARLVREVVGLVDELKGELEGELTAMSALSAAATSSPATPVTHATLAALFGAPARVTSLTASVAALQVIRELLEQMRTGT